jgi:hypothetical protein
MIIESIKLEDEIDLVFNVKSKHLAKAILEYDCSGEFNL